MTRTPANEGQRVNTKLLLRIFKCAIHHTLYVCALCTTRTIAHLKCACLMDEMNNWKTQGLHETGDEMERHFLPLNKTLWY